ncbi:hypothetical protein B0T20DRAFT_415809 [Sordaria brevicollis]|uniref:Uncharacterized protein n=1 Tax=Sordaria brevicollis TaxID=83679 RepID=A0AAE0UAT3_SORBR|nr:hypothetical protein B0T20DRAFT_415809 [Sordaria brevicollis]
MIAWIAFWALAFLGVFLSLSLCFEARFAILIPPFDFCEHFQAVFYDFLIPRGNAKGINCLEELSLVSTRSQ